QLSEPPQPSPAGPQPMPTWAQVLGTQPAPPSGSVPVPVPPQTLDWPPPPQLCGVVQVPQLSNPPQPSATGPQLAPPSIASAQLFGTQPATPPHTLGVPPPPQVSGAKQVPQSIELPQPSPAGPQLKPKSAQVFGTQVLVPPPS